MTMLKISLKGVPETLQAIESIAGKHARIKYTRIALSAAGGILKPEVAKRVPRETGTAAKSIGVRTTVHKDGNGGTARVGAKRTIKVAVVTAKTGKRKVLATFTTKKDKTIKVSGVKRYEKAKAAGTSIHYRKPSRYLHLINNGTKRGVTGRRFMEASIAAKGQAAADKAIAKIREALNIETAKHAKVGV